MLHIAVFAVLGPLVATLAAVIIGRLLGPGTIGVREVSFYLGKDILDPWPYYAGYNIGVVPAALTGIIDYNLARRQRGAKSTVLLIPFIGWAISLIAFGVLYGVSTWGPMWWEPKPPPSSFVWAPGWAPELSTFLLAGGLYASSGAVAAVVCHVLMRILLRTMKA